MAWTCSQKKKLLEDIQRIADEPEGPTMIYVTHHTEEILPFFTKLPLLKDGTIYKNRQDERAAEAGHIE